MRLSATILFAILLMRPSLAMELTPATAQSDNKWVQLNIGGFIILTTKESIKLSGLPFLLNLIDERYDTQSHNIDGGIPIDRPQADGQIIDWYLRTHEFQRNWNIDVLKNMADFYGGEHFKSLVKEHSKRLNLQRRKYMKLVMHPSDLVRIAYDVKEFLCPICFEAIGAYFPTHEIQHHSELVVNHLLKYHRAQVEQIKYFYSDRYYQVRFSYEDEHPKLRKGSKSFQILHPFTDVKYPGPNGSFDHYHEFTCPFCLYKETIKNLVHCEVSLGNHFRDTHKVRILCAEDGMFGIVYKPKS